MPDAEKQAAAPKKSRGAAEEIAALALAKAQAEEQGHPRAQITRAAVAGAPISSRVVGLGMDNVAAGVRLLTDFLVDRFGDDLEALVKQEGVADFLATWVSRKALDLADSLVHLAQGPRLARVESR